MTKLNSRNNRRSRGFTVVELVVAMAVILIVSATAISLINTQNTVYLRTLQTVEATNMAENAIECFRYAGSENFKAVYEKSLNQITLVDDTDNGKTDYTFETNGMEVIITIEGDTITFTAHDGNKVILTKSYTK